MARCIWIAGCLLTISLFAGCDRKPTAENKPGASQPPASTAPGAAPSPQSPPSASSPDESQTPPANTEYQELFAATDNPLLLDRYQRIEALLASNPKDDNPRLQRVSVLYTAASALMSQNKREQALQAFLAASKDAQLVPTDSPLLNAKGRQFLANVYYNGACATALSGQASAAKDLLDRAIEMGWSDLEQLQSDPDLVSVRGLPGFQDDLNRWAEQARQSALKTAQEELAKSESFPFDFTAADLSGQEQSLANLKGKVVIVDFWGTWCPPCRAEIPAFVKLQGKFGPQGLQIIGLNYERAQDEAAEKAVRDFIQSNGIDYPCAMGSEEIKAQVPNFQGYPTTLFLDRQGKVRLKTVGLHDYSYLEAIVLALLDESST